MYFYKNTHKQKDTHQIYKKGWEKREEGEWGGAWTQAEITNLLNQTIHNRIRVHL